jgi:hypothetical protein
VRRVKRAARAARAWWAERSSAERWALGLGAGVAALAIVSPRQRIEEDPEPVIVVTGPGVVQVPAVWTPIAGSPIALRPGVRYRACVELGWVVDKLATDTRVREALEAEGFRDVQIRRDVSGCDRQIEATYAGPPKAKDRPSQLTRAWELR